MGEGGGRMSERVRMGVEWAVKERERERGESVGGWAYITVERPKAFGRRKS